MQEILALRQEEAQLLGYRNFGELSLVPKMAESPKEVVEFLRDLAAKARPFAERDLADLQNVRGRPISRLTELSALGHGLRRSSSSSRRATRSATRKSSSTSPRRKCLPDLFKIVETLFDVAIRAGSGAGLERQGHVFPDRAQRPVARSVLPGLGRAHRQTRRRLDGRCARALAAARRRPLQTPVAQLVCNFAAGVGDQPPLLTHDDVTTLFHEFGHGLHHMLTQVNERDVSGISGVEWDAVELPSQFMENFCWEWDVLRHMTAHVNTGEPLPRALFDKMLAAKNFQSGLQTLRQVELSLFDMLLHTEHDADDDVMALLGKVRAEVALLAPPDWNRTAHTFSHIFSGGYAAGYYSYKWAEVLSADAYAAFEESAGPDGAAERRDRAAKYREAILEVGGSRPAMESFKAFRGRAPTLDALLRHEGMDSSRAAATGRCLRRRSAAARNFTVGPRSDAARAIGLTRCRR